MLLIHILWTMKWTSIMEFLIHARAGLSSRLYMIQWRWCKRYDSGVIGTGKRRACDFDINGDKYD